MGKVTFKDMSTGHWVTRNNYDTLWVKEIDGPWTIKKHESGFIVEETGAPDEVDDPIVVSCEFAAKLVRAKLNSNHWNDLGSMHGQYMDSPEYEDNAEYMGGYYSGYQFAMEDRCRYTQNLMDRFPESDPDNNDWSGDDYGQTVWDTHGRYDEEYTVQYVLPIIWGYCADNGIKLDEIPPGAAVRNVSIETMNAVFSDGSDNFIAYGEQTA